MQPKNGILYTFYILLYGIRNRLVYRAKLSFRAGFYLRLSIFNHHNELDVGAVVLLL